MTSIAKVRLMPFKQDGMRRETARSIARLFRIAAEMRVDVAWRDLGTHRRGEYRDGDGGRYYDGCGLIVLNPRLDGLQVAQTLGHEIAHAMFGDRKSTPVAEERATRIGMALALDPAQFRRARLAEARGQRLSYGFRSQDRALLSGSDHGEGGCPCGACIFIRMQVRERLDELQEEAAQIRENMGKLTA